MAIGDLSFAIDPSKGDTPQSIARKRQMAEAILGSATRAPRDIGEGLNAIGQAIMYRQLSKGADKAEAAGQSGASKVFQSLFGGSQFPDAPSLPAPTPSAATPAAAPTAPASPANVSSDIGSGIKATAAALGIDPIDLGTAISYETAGTFDPAKKGPTTQWGQHKGLIQFGEPQAKEYGVDWDNPVASQLGPDGAVAKYLTAHGVKPGMKLLDIYSAINAGGVGKYDASDANNGGAPGTVRDKVEKQMAQHRAKAMALLGGDAPVQVASNDASIGMPAPLAFSPEQLQNGNRLASASDLQLDGSKQMPDDGRVFMRPQMPHVPPVTPVRAGPPPLTDREGTQSDTYAPPPMPDPYAAIQQQLAGQPNDAKAAIARAMSGQGQSFPPEMGPQDARPVSGPSITPPELDANSIPQPVKERIAAALMQQQPIGGTPMPLQAPAGAAVTPQAVPAPSAPETAPVPVQADAGLAPQLPPPTSVQDRPVADASQMDLNQIPVEAGGNAGAIQPGAQQGPSIEQLMQAASNPWLNDAQRGVVGALLKQRMTAADPAAQLEMEKTRLEMEKMRIETQQLINPQMSPGDKARLDFDREKLAADQKKLMELSPGTTVFDPNSRQPVFSAPEKAEAKPAGIQEYEYAKQQGFPGTFQDWEASKKGGMSLQVDPTTGEVTFQQGGNIKPMTEAQSKDTTFATRAEGALPLVDKFGDALTSLQESAGGQVPVIGNYMKSKEYQQAEQAGKEFLQAILRKDTGAAITAGETAEYGSVYLPRPGDSPELLAQKKASRARALEALKAGMTPQALLAQEKALVESGTPAAEAPKKRLKFNPATGELE